MTDKKTDTKTDTKIAFLGIGLMGLPMAKNLCIAGLNITVWNRSADKTKPLVKHGAGVATTPMDAVQGASIIISMVSDGAVFGRANPR